MKKTTNILLLAFIGLTTLLVIVHLEKVVYFVDSKTKESIIQIQNKDFSLSYSLHEESENRLRFDLNFNNIRTKLRVDDLKVKINNFKISEIEPYWGMKNWDNEKYKRFSDIPDSLRHLSTESNPYYAYDHLFEEKSNIKQYNVEIETLIYENGLNYRIRKKSIIDKIYKIEVRPWDMHNDFSFLLIYLFGFISILLLAIKATTTTTTIIIKTRKKRNTCG